MTNLPRGVNSAPRRPWLAAAVAATLVFAPLFRAGQHPLALMVLELAALGMLLAVLWRTTGPISRREWVAVGLLGLLPLLYLIPLPLELVARLPGRAPYIDAWRAAFGPDGMPSMIPLSLVPVATEAAWLTLAIPIAVFLAVRVLSPRTQLALVYLLLAVVGAEAALGLMQFGSGPESPLYFGMRFTHFGSAVGTYTNKNHLAGLIAMTLPVCLALLFYSAGHGHDRRGGRRARAAFLASTSGQQALIYAALAVLLLVATTFTRSRMGLALAMLGILLCVSLFSRRIGGNNAFGTVGRCCRSPWGSWSRSVWYRSSTASRSRA